MAKKENGFFAEFKKFITRGNIVDMSVGVIVGGAFTAIVNGLSNFILKPIINWFLALILGTDSLSGIFTYLKKVEVTDPATNVTSVDLSQSIYIDWGSFINAIINFLIIAFVLFCIVRMINRISDPKAREQALKDRIAYKLEHNIRLTKKEAAYVKAEEERLAAEEAARLAAEEEAANAPKPVTTEDLLAEIRDLLKNK